MRPRLIIIGDVILEDANTQAPTRTFISARGAGWSRSFFCHLTLFCYTERVLMENRNGLMIDLRVGQASGRAECEQGLEMLQELRGPRRITVASDKGYDTAAFVASCRALKVTPLRKHGGPLARFHSPRDVPRPPIRRGDDGPAADPLGTHRNRGGRLPAAQASRRLDPATYGRSAHAHGVLRTRPALSSGRPNAQ